MTLPFGIVRFLFCTDLSAVVWFVLKHQNNMGVSKNRGFSPKTSIKIIGVPIIFTIHFGGNTPIFGNTQKTKPSIQQMEDGENHLDHKPHPNRRAPINFFGEGQVDSTPGQGSVN